MRPTLIAVTLGLSLATTVLAQQTDETVDPPAGSGEATAGQQSGAAPAPSGMMQGQPGMGMMQGRPGMAMMQDRPGMGMMQGRPGKGMMGHPMMGGRGHRAMGPGMRTMMFVMLDTDGDEVLSLEEVLAVHERMFRHVDADDDGKLTMQELEAFMDTMHPLRN